VVDGDATPVEVEYGQRVRVRMRNDTKMYHPMHLHGHSYRVITEGNDWNQSHAPVKDTVAVAPGDTVDIEFLAENPGRWFFHCHNLYHAVTGMARQVVYLSPS
ncbi:MAG: multicopper oxidase domain-containing protein, partial [Planctomycetota bacterium]|nr:multicopper oxidase domain-containing protein [Planctomycetota bacterium]